METLQKFSVPIAIIIAGALIAFAIKGGVGTSDASKQASAGAAVQKLDLRTIQESDHVRGPRDAKVAVIEYTDTECPFCKQFHNTLAKVKESYIDTGKSVAWVYRYYPIPQLHPKAPKEAAALECAFQQGGDETFWKFTDAVYAATKANNSLDIGSYNIPKEVPVGPDGNPYYTQRAARYEGDAGALSDIAAQIGLDKNVFEECLSTGATDARVDVDIKEGGEIGVRGTPFAVFVSKDKVSSETRKLVDSLGKEFQDTFAISPDGKRIAMSGALPYEIVSQILDSMTK